jgi:hypothetical protein
MLQVILRGTPFGAAPRETFRIRVQALLSQVLQHLLTQSFALTFV